MLIETENSTYEIQGNQIRKVAGEPSERHSVGEEWLTFRYLYDPPDPPEVDKRLVVIIGDGVLRTSKIKAIIYESFNEED